MIEPKTFYRKLDALVAAIGKAQTSRNFLYSVLTELQNTFGDELHIGNGRLYKESGDGFKLVHSSDVSGIKSNEVKIPFAAEAVQSVLKHGSYIYNDPSLRIDAGSSPNGEYVSSMAFTVRSRCGAGFLSTT